MPAVTEVQTVSDSQGNPVAVIVPIDVWRAIESERQAAHPSRSETLQKRLAGARERNARVSDEELAALMAEFAEEDRELAEMGMEDYACGLAQEDAAPDATEYLLSGETMRSRLLAAVARNGESGITMEEACTQLGISPHEVNTT